MVSTLSNDTNAAQFLINAKEHKVVAVTVYQADRAVVTRRFPVELKAGQNEIKITRLSNVLDSDSIRVEATSVSSDTQALTVFDVVFIDPTRDTVVVPEIQLLNEERDIIQAHLDVLQHQKIVLSTYSDGITGKDSTPERLEAFLDLYSSRQERIHKETTELNKEKDRLNAQINSLNTGAWYKSEETRSNGVTVVMLAEEEGPAELTISYVVRNANWTSLYDVRADLSGSTSSSKAAEASGPSVAVQYRAKITQSTGEDWKDVSLTLSTASPQLGSEIPTLQTWRVGPVPLHVVKAVGSGRGKKGLGGGGAFRHRRIAFETESDAENSDDGDAFIFTDNGPTVAVREGAISSTFEIEGLSNIPSDSSSHKVSIATIDLSADLEWVTVPRSLTTAFLNCHIKNTSVFQLIGGPSNIFMDGNFVAKSNIPTVSPSESFSCSLGADPSVRITYHPVQKSVATTSGGIMSFGSTKTRVTAFRQRISIKNTRASTPLGRLVVRDRVPISEDTRIKVTVAQPSDKALGPISGSSSVNLVSSPGTANASSMGSLSRSATITSASAFKLASGDLSFPIARVSHNVIARWAQKSEENGGTGGARGDGIIEWIASDVRSEEPLELELAYNVSAPIDVQWQDL